MFKEFFIPYIQALHGAAYSVHQTLDGYGLASTSFIEKDASGKIVNGYWSPEEAVMIPFGGLIIYSFLLLLSVLASGYVLSRWKGLFVVIALVSVPGVLNIFGLWPEIIWTPRSYAIDEAGVLGEVIGFVPLLILGLVTGWSLVVNIYDTFLLNDKFRNMYDHFWYCSAIIAGIFFVTDSGINKNREKLLQENKASQLASKYLLDQLKEYDAYCDLNKISSKASCRWAADVQRDLIKYAYYDEKLYYQLGPKNSNDLYVIYSNHNQEESAITIRKEIKKYNDEICRVTRISENVSRLSRSSLCQMTPAQFCRSYPDPPKGLVDEHIIIKPVALASECIIPTLVVSRKIQEKLHKTVDSGAKKGHERWFYFVIFSIFAGGKIANASTKLLSVDQRMKNQRRRLMSAGLALMFGLWRVVILGSRLFAQFFGIARSSMRVTIKGVKYLPFLFVCIRNYFRRIFSS